jgi:hypothetical protein
MLMLGVATPCSTAMTIGIIGGGQRGRAAEAEMNQGKKQGQHRQNEQRGCGWRVRTRPWSAATPFRR